MIGFSSISILLPLLQMDESLRGFESTTPPVAKEMSLGMIVFLVLITILINIIFGLWAKARGDEHDINPAVAFAAGFFLNYIGVIIVRYLRMDRIFYQPKPHKDHQWRQPVRPQGVPIPPIGPPPGAIPPPMQPLPQPQYAPQVPPQPMMQPRSAAAPAVAPVEPPVMPSDEFEPVLQPPAAPVPASAPTRQLDAFGFVICPGCGGRVKQGRKRCGNCGAAL